MKIKMEWFWSRFIFTQARQRKTDQFNLQNGRWKQFDFTQNIWSHFKKRSKDISHLFSRRIHAVAIRDMEH